MLKRRATWFILIVVTIIVGLLSRRIPGIPLFVGDIVWATMVYFGVRFLFVARSIKFSVLSSLLFCYVIEASQLYQAPWINSIRHTVIGALILGEVFSWGDLLSYTAGVAIGVLIGKFIEKPTA